MLHATCTRKRMQAATAHVACRQAHGRRKCVPARAACSEALRPLCPLQSLHQLRTLRPLQHCAHCVTATTAAL